MRLLPREQAADALAGTADHQQKHYDSGLHCMEQHASVRAALRSCMLATIAYSFESPPGAITITGTKTSLRRRKGSVNGSS